MNLKRLRYLIFALSVLTVSYTFTGGDCGTEDNPPAATSVAAPTNIKVILNQASGSFATVTWTHSSDQSRSDFNGYRVVTYEVDTTNSVISTFRVDNVPKTSNSQVINSIIPLRRYRTYVTALSSTNNIKSDSVWTVVYAAVYEREGETIDEYQASGSAQSGYGWNTEFGIGTKYAFTGANASNIDLHVREEGTQGIRFYSPNLYSPGTKMTKFELVGQGQSAYDNTDLVEPTSSSTAIIQDNVYLLKLESNNYVKIWVKGIASTAGYRTITFDFKVQPIVNLRVLKR